MNRYLNLALAALLLTLPLASTGNAQASTTTINMRCTHTAVQQFDTVDMETGYHGFFDCWAHYGIHTYFLGRENLYALHGGSGFIKSVERHLSPPIELSGLSTLVQVETSIDGISWTLVASIPLAITNQNFNAYSFTADGEHFRFIRIREPLSAAQGLSGYLDYSDMAVTVETVSSVAPLTLTAQQGSPRSCEYDILEDVWALHPCWYGAIEHWDSPSWWHTYFLGNATLDAVRGNATALFFRPQQQGQPVAGVLTGTLLVQTSFDGMTWDTVGTQPITYGLPASFSVSGLNQKEVKFVRVATDKHPAFFGPTPDFRRPEGFLLHSGIEMDGSLP